jgi:adenosylcobyric acid synthase
MIQGCGSDVGKSVLVAGLCRLFANRGLRVRPFKPQNMSNNAAVTADGGEIGRAQALQAIACRVPPTVDMNPVLLKPQSDTAAQVIVQGRVIGLREAGPYQARKRDLLPTVLESFHRLKAESDLVIVEGAGSPAETNLRAFDIANMGFSIAAQVPVVLVGDIDRGHVIAALVGAREVLSAEDRAMIHGFIINKFRGDPLLFTEGRADIVRRTGWHDFGMVPWVAAARALPSEDSVIFEGPRAPSGKTVRVVVPLLSRIANFDDFDPLKAEPNVRFDFIPPGTALPGDADLIILPGTKSTLADLAFMRAQGWDIDIKAHVRRGGHLLGVCGGFQMLGRWVADTHGLDGAIGREPGLGYLDVETILADDKTVRPVSGALREDGAAFDGYEIHLGRTTGAGLGRSFLTFADGRADGAVSDNGRITGTYVHGLFGNAAARASLLKRLGATAVAGHHAERVDAALDGFADELARSLQIDALAKLAGLP